MSPDDLRRLFPNISPDVLARNTPRVAVPDTKPAKQARALGKDDEGKTPSARRPLVCFTLRRVKLLDPDAKYGSVKDLLDGLHYAGLIRGDREDEINLQVEQERVPHYFQEQTIIEIFYHDEN